MKSLFEQNGGTYTAVGDYLLPDLVLLNQPESNINIWGKRRLNYLKKHRRILYSNLLLSGKLAEHLNDLSLAAGLRKETIIRQMAEAQGFKEQLKAKNQMLWVRKMNNIMACADEVISHELVYD